MLRANHRSVAPPLAAHFPNDEFLAPRHGPGQDAAQIKVAAHAVMIVAGETEDRLGVIKIDAVFDFAAPRDALRIVKRQVNDQRLQLGKRCRQTGRLQHALALFEAISRPRTVFGLVGHNSTYRKRHVIRALVRS